MVTVGNDEYVNLTVAITMCTYIKLSHCTSEVYAILNCQK